MNSLNLTLRQRKLLHLIQNKKEITTGAELARELNVSARTIRSDISEINRVLENFRARINSEKSKGYFFTAADPIVIQQKNQIDTAFFTAEDRIRYLSFQLCLSDTPISMFDLEDEMFISHSTLEHDLQAVRTKYGLSIPYIGISIEKNTVCFEPDEQKKRQVLNLLFHEDWNYDTSGNAYYDYHFLDKKILEYIMNEIPKHLSRFRIQMEDSSLVALNLALAIMYQRCTSGHPLPEKPITPKSDPPAMQAAESIMDALEKELGCSFSHTERDSIYLKIASGHLMDASKLSFETISLHFGPVTQTIVEQYLDRIYRLFSVDLRDDEDFYITLLQFIRYLQSPDHLLNTQENLSIAKENLQIEYELAWILQPIALEYMNHYLDESELLHLAHCLSGAVEYLYHNHPEKKLRTVICCHLHLSETWALKRKVLGAFDNYITVTSLLPVNAGSAFDFSETDLVLSTVSKKISGQEAADTIQISPLMTSSDYRSIERYIQIKRVLRYCSDSRVTWEDFVSRLQWPEPQDFEDRFSLLNWLSDQYVSGGIVTDEFKNDILRRESISSFAFCSGLLLVYSHVSAKETLGSVLILKHRMNWKGYRIRAVVISSFLPEDLPFLFQLKTQIFSYNQNPDKINSLRTKEDFLSLFLSDHLAL